MASFGSSPTTPLMSCVSGQAVVTSLQNIARLSHVRKEELLEALHNTQEEYDTVEVTSKAGEITIDDPTYTGEGRGVKARIIQGKNRAAVWGETTPLLTSSSPSFSTVFSVQPSSVTIRAAHAPDDPLLMIPQSDDTCGIVIPTFIRTPSFLPTLPPAIKQVKEIGIKDDGYYYVVVEYARPAVAWVTLIAAVIGLSSKAVVSETMYPPTIPPEVKSVWMTSVCTAAFLVLAFMEYIGLPDHSQLREMLEGRPVSELWVYMFGLEERRGGRLEREAEIPCFTLLMVLLASTLHGFFSISFLVSLSYTTLAQCVVLMNLHPILVLSTRINRSYPSEKVGAFICCFGVCSLLYTSSNTVEGSNPILGNLLAFTVSVYMWIYLNLSQQLQVEVPNCIMMGVINLVSLTIQLVFVLVTGGARDELYLMQFSSYAVPNALGGLVGGTLAYGGFMLSAKYLNPLVVSVHITLEPLFAVLLNVIIGGASPPIATWGSLIVLVIGAVLVAIGGKNEQEDKLVTDQDYTSLLT
eukprot:TRINITY_DN4487_c0_g1_i1.p1 TRINITY_DN4487_c0_g1~~TRINITY_DN4487_c0_g1_i1.p1  ORF type:complete len:524 (+),score=148.41 TRINITY_DN4487_c0_g1_i1:1608-3179(+)